jgi:excisionase family DNA binding protein
MHENGTRLEPLAVDIPEACRLTGLGRSKLYELLSAGDIPSVKIGKRRVVPVASLRQWLAKLSNSPAQGAA